MAKSYFWGVFVQDMQIDIIVFIACYTERKLKTGQKNAKKKLADRGGIDWWSSGKGKEGSIGGHPVRGKGVPPCPIHPLRSIPHICLFFTQAKFSEKKIYTESYTVNCQFTQ